MYFREAYKAGEVLRDWLAVLVLLRAHRVRGLVPLGQILDMEHPRVLVITPGFPDSFSHNRPQSFDCDKFRRDLTRDT